MPKVQRGKLSCSSLEETFRGAAITAKGRISTRGKRALEVALGKLCDWAEPHRRDFRPGPMAKCEKPETDWDLAQIVRRRFPRLGHQKFETFVMVTIDKNGCAQAHKLCDGGKSSCAVYPSQIIARAIEAGAVEVAFAHNHPSGCTRPSPEDEALTAQMAYKMRRIEGGPITVRDHVILTAGGYGLCQFPRAARRSGLGWGSTNGLLTAAERQQAEAERRRLNYGSP